MSLFRDDCECPSLLFELEVFSLSSLFSLLLFLPSLFSLHLPFSFLFFSLFSSLYLNVSLLFHTHLHTHTHPAVIPEYNALNLGAVDRKIQSDMHFALTRALEIVSKFTTQMSTFHSYLEQVRKEGEE